MILIADSGSTKTAWRTISNGAIQQFNTPGINPSSMDIETCTNSVMELQAHISFEQVTQLFFYGAGITTITSPVWMEALQKICTNAKVVVENDLVGAARACYGNSSGLIGILGTGSNIGLFDGSKISIKAPALGYILGDEGAGVSIGKQIIKGYYRGSWSAELKSAFERKFTWNTAQFVHELYSTNHKASFLAQFSKWAFQQRKYPEIQELIINVFQEFCDMLHETFGKEQLTLCLVGSVAYYWSDYLKKVASENDIMIQQIIESPIAALTLYHQNN